MISCQSHRNWVEINLARSAKKNALNFEMWCEIKRIIGEIDCASETLKFLVIRGDGGCFSAGADIKEFANKGKDKTWLKENNRLIKETQQALARLSIPSLAMIEGACVGGGCGLALACDYRIASEDSFFALTPIKLGLLYSLEDTKRLVDLIGLSRAKQMLFLGEKVNAQTALQWGLVNEVLSSSEALAERHQALVDKFSGYSKHALIGIKQTFNYLQDPSQLSPEELEEHFDAAFETEEHLEGVKPFIK